MALEIGHRINGPSSISTFEGTGTYKLLFRVLQDDPEELEVFYDETLAPVVAYDSRYGTELVHTLTDIPRQRRLNRERPPPGSSPTGTPSATGWTASDELTGLDVDKSEDRESLTLGIKVMQLLGRVPERPTNYADR